MKEYPVIPAQVRVIYWYLKRKTQNMDEQTWIKIYRKMTKWEWSDNPNVGWLFIHCLMGANYEDKKWHGITIKKGSFVTSIKSLSKKVGLSPMQTRYSLNKLKVTNELTTKTTNRYTIVTVNNWDLYQDDNRQFNKQVTNKQQTNNKQITTTKEIKNNKNISLNRDMASTPNPEIELILSLYKKTMGFSPTDRKPRMVAQNIRQIIKTFIKELAPYKEFNFDDTVKRAFKWYGERDEMKGETLDVFKRKLRILLDKSREKYKGGDEK